MSVELQKELHNIAQRVVHTSDPLLQTCLYLSVKVDIDDYKMLLPASSQKDLSIIERIGVQAKAYLETRREVKLLWDTPEEDSNDAPIDLKGEIIVDENNLINRTIRFVSNNSRQIIASASSVALGVLGALYLGAPYPVRVGSLAGAIAFLGAKSLI